MPLQRRERLIAAQRSQSTVGVHGRIRQATGSVATNAVSNQRMASNVQLFKEREPEIGTDTTDGLTVVVRAERGNGAVAVRKCGRFAARIYTVAETTQNAKKFVVTKSRFCSHLEDEVRHGVE